MATTDSQSQTYLDKKDHDLGEKEKQQIRDRIGHGDGDVYKLAAEFHCTPIQVAGIKAAMHREGTARRRTPITTSKDMDDPADRKEFLHHLFTSARYRALKAKMDFKLTHEIVEELYDQQEGRCAISGYPFNFERFPEALVKMPFAPSIDRVLSSGDYTEDNVRLVCVAVNFGINQWGKEVYMKLARAATHHEPKQERDEEAPPAGAVVDGKQPEKNDLERQCTTRDERLYEAEKLLPQLPESDQRKQRHRIAGFKAALTKRFLRLKAEA
jgi:hypothetical protein